MKAQPEDTIAEAFPAAAFPHLPASANDQACGDVASFRMAIRNGMFPRGWKDIPEEKRKLPFVFRAALEEALLNGLGPLELDEVRRMAVEYGDACVFHKAILGGLFPGGWKDIPEDLRKRLFVREVARKMRLCGTPRKLRLGFRSRARLFPWIRCLEW